MQDKGIVGMLVLLVVVVAGVLAANWISPKLQLGS